MINIMSKRRVWRVNVLGKCMTFYLFQNVSTIPNWACNIFGENDEMAICNWSQIFAFYTIVCTKKI